MMKGPRRYLQLTEMACFACCKTVLNASTIVANYVQRHVLLVAGITYRGDTGIVREYIYIYVYICLGGGVLFVEKRENGNYYSMPRCT